PRGGSLRSDLPGVRRPRRPPQAGGLRGRGRFQRDRGLPAARLPAPARAGRLVAAGRDGTEPAAASREPTHPPSRLAALLQPALVPLLLLGRDAARRSGHGQPPRDGHSAARRRRTLPNGRRQATAGAGRRRGVCDPLARAALGRSGTPRFGSLPLLDAVPGPRAVPVVSTVRPG